MALIQRTRYELAVNSWTPSSIITVATPDGTSIAYFPLAFVQTGGNDTWEYIHEVVDMLVHQRGGQIQSQAGEPVLPAAAPTAGTFIYNHPGKSDGTVIDHQRSVWKRSITIYSQQSFLLLPQTPFLSKSKETDG